MFAISRIYSRGTQFNFSIKVVSCFYIYQRCSIVISRDRIKPLYFTSSLLEIQQRQQKKEKHILLTKKKKKKTQKGTNLE